MLPIFLPCDKLDSPEERLRWKFKEDWHLRDGHRKNLIGTENEKEELGDQPQRMGCLEIRERGVQEGIVNTTKFPRKVQ